MFRDLIELLDETKRRVFSSRIFILILLNLLLIGILSAKLFNLQIVQGKNFQENYVQQTKKEVELPSTRGNIYDRNGNLLAYNELSYSVTVSETGYYTALEFNEMIYRLVKILIKHGENVVGALPIIIGESGEYEFDLGSETAKKRFLRDYYGLKSVEELDIKPEHRSDITAAELIEQRYQRYELFEIKDERGNTVLLSPLEKLAIINIRYSVALSYYHRYNATKVAVSISEDTKTEVLENTDKLIGVDVLTETVRRYNNSIYFSPVIGYTGRISEEQFEELKATNPDYDENDIVGRAGVEQSMEAELKGRKGNRTIIVDNVGHIMDMVSETPAVSGNSVYLTIDSKLQIGIYHLIEQQLAGVLAAKLDIADDPNTDTTDSTNRKIPVKDAYFQLINNNVLSMEHFAAPEASATEAEIYRKFLSYRDSALAEIRQEVMSLDARTMAEVEDDKRAFMYYIYTTISKPDKNLVIQEKLDTNADYFLRWKEDSISLRDFLYAGIENNWINTTELDINSKYSNADNIFQALIDHAIEDMKQDQEYAKLTYKHMIKLGIITGRELCLALYDQGVLEYDLDAVNRLSIGGENTAFDFLIEKIRNIEITPAQLALDPCTAGAVVTDTNTGEVLALVSYPGYDSNLLVNTIDVKYYNKINNDQSEPFYNKATQAKKAPGSTFKPISAVAGLEEGVIGAEEKIECTGIYDIITPTIKCWIHPGHHGKLDTVGAIQNSCNYYFVDIGHRLSLNENGEYSTDLGLSKIYKYAALFGLDHKSGVELAEIEPEISKESPESSAIGQGSHSFANVQLNRYVTAIANRGNVFNLSIIDKITDGKDNVVQDFTPSIFSHIDISNSTWDYVQLGMKKVVEEGSAKFIFSRLPVEIAGKTGTAQESKTRANHAYFVSFAPFAKPEIAVTVNIPYGYTSSNAAYAAKNIYELYFGYTDLETILGNKAMNISNVKIGD